MGDGNTILHGILTSGSGEGAFFMSLEPYVVNINKKLGFIPFKGTFNLKTDKQQAQNFINLLQLININGFQKGIKKFGEVKCYPCKIKQIPCAIVIPEFTRYNLDVVEIISESELRKEFNVKDGDKIVIELQ